MKNGKQPLQLFPTLSSRHCYKRLTAIRAGEHGDPVDRHSRTHGRGVEGTVGLRMRSGFDV